MEIRSIGIDLGKTTFHLVALGRRGEVLVRRKLTQKQLLTYTANPAGDPSRARPLIARRSN
jgi:transposase